MCAAATVETLLQHIAAMYPRLPRRLREIAHYVERNQAWLALDNASDVASRCNVKPATVSRFAQRMGFCGFRDFRAVFRDEFVMEERGGSGSASPRQPLHVLLNELRFSFSHSLSAIDDETFRTAIDLLVSATQVHVLSASRGEALAAHWIYALQLIGRRASVIDMHAEVAYGRWHGMAPDEVLIAVVFAPYPARVLSEIHEASQRGVDVICITDRMHPRFVRDAAIVLRMPAPRGLDFDSVAVTMCMCQALLTALAARLGLYFDETVQTGEYDD